MCGWEKNSMKSRNLKRDKLTSFLLIIGLVLTNLLVLYSVDIMDKWLLESVNKKGEGHCIWQKYYSVEGVADIPNTDGGISEEEEKEIDNKVQEISNQLYSALDKVCLLELNDVHVALDQILMLIDGKEKTGNMTFVLSSEEKFYRTLQDGQYLMDENVCYVGDAIFDSKKVDEKKYIMLNKEKIYVAGIFKNYKAYGDDQVCVYYDKLKQETKESVMEAVQYKIKEKLAYDLSSNVIISVGSNDSEKNISETIEKIENIFSDYNNIEIKEITLNEENQNTEMEELAKIKFIILMLVLTFVLANIYQISKLWIFRKRKNIGVVKAFGMSNGKIYMLVLKQLLVHIIVSFVFTIIIATGLQFSDIIIGEMRIFRLLGIDFVISGILIVIIVIINTEMYLKKNVMEVIKH